MKFLIAIVTLVGTMFLWEANAYYFEDIERYWTASPTNDVLFSLNQSEPSQIIEFKKTIDEDNPLLLTATVTNTDNNEIMYTGEGLNICSKYDSTTWDYVAVRLFNRAIIPGPKRRKCPVSPQEYEIHRWQYDLVVDLSPNVPYGKYEIAYTAETDKHELVFSTLKFRFAYNDHSGFGR